MENTITSNLQMLPKKARLFLEASNKRITKMIDEINKHQKAIEDLGAKIEVEQIKRHEYAVAGAWRK